MPLTLGQKMLVQGFELQLKMYGHVLMSGTNTFPCLMTPASPADLDIVEMFSDIREVSVATVLNSDEPAWIVAQMTLTDEMGQDWVSMKRVNNPSNIATEFWLQKVTDKDH